MLLELIASLIEPTLWASLFDMQQLLTGETTEPLLGSCGVHLEYTSTCSLVEVSAVPLSGNCPAASMTKVGAAFATIGYYVQSDILDFLSFGVVGKLAPLIYVIAGIGAFIGVALGAPPKNYVWFVLGPTIYAFLIDTRQPVHGVEWVVAKRIQNMAEVWELAETGIVGTNYYLRMLSDDIPGTYSSNVEVTHSRAPTIPSRPSTVFVWFDAFVSHAVQFMVAWTGIGNSVSPGMLRADSVNASQSNIAVPGDFQPATGFHHNRWYLLSHLKWKYINSITAARINSTYLRDGFHTFMAGECGDALRRGLDHQRYAASQIGGLGDTNDGPRSIADTVFRHYPSSTDDKFNYGFVIEALASQKMPFPELLNDFLRPTLIGGQDEALNFIYAMSWGEIDGVKLNTREDILKFLRGDHERFQSVSQGQSDQRALARRQSFLQMREVRCDLIFNLIMLGVQWEAGHYYHQIFKREHNRPQGVTDQEILQSLFYGWNIRGPDGSLLGDGDGLMGVGSGMADFKFFIKQLIALHILRNEYVFAFKEEGVNLVRTDGDKVQSTVIGYNRSVADRSKFGEIYVWAMLVPYLQGLLLYGLAILFPFACLLMIMPGMHKALFTWMSFWAWAKLWDVGFAIVLSVERSLWAILGKTSNLSGAIGTRIVESITPGNKFNGGYFVPRCIEDSCTINEPVCAVPEVRLLIPDSGGASLLTGTGEALDLLGSTIGNLRFFDNLLSVATNLDLDVSNSYYIFLISGLYLAVPAVMGQLVLGAKAGAASLATQVISGVATEGGQAAKSYAQGENAQIIKAAQNSIGQAAYAKAMRKNGLAAAVLDEQNKAAEAGLKRDYNQQMSSIASQAGNQAITGYQKRQATLGIGMAVADYWFGDRTGGGYFSRKGDGEQGSGGQGSEGTGLPSQGKGSRNFGNTDVRSQGYSPIAVGGNSNSRASGAIGRLLKSKGEEAANSAANGIIGSKTGALSDGERLGAGRMMRELGNELLGPDARRLMGQVGSNDLQTRISDANAHYGAMQSHFAVQGFMPAQESTGHQQHAGRLAGGAGYQAEMARWKALNSYAHSMAGEATALGVFAGSLDAGSKPTSDMAGMAMSGLFGGDAQDHSNFFSQDYGPGGFFSMAENRDRALQSVGGYHPMHDIHRGINEGSSPWTELGNAGVVGIDNALLNIPSMASPNTAAIYERDRRLRMPIGDPSTPRLLHGPARADGSFDAPQRMMPFDGVRNLNWSGGEEK